MKTKLGLALLLMISIAISGCSNSQHTSNVKEDSKNIGTNMTDKSNNTQNTNTTIDLTKNSNDQDSKNKPLLNIGNGKDVFNVRLNTDKNLDISIDQMKKTLTCSLSERVKKAIAENKIKLSDYPIKVEMSGEKKYIGKFAIEYKVSLLFGKADFYLGNTSEDRYVDVAKLYLFTDESKREIVNFEVEPKYSKKDSKEFTLKNAAIGTYQIFGTIDEKENDIKYDGGISNDYGNKDINISISNYRIAGITTESSKYKTPEGLGVGDDKQKVIELYGMPDKGFYVDHTWKYYIYRDWNDDGSMLLCDDYFEIEFNDNGKMTKMKLSAYIPID